MVPQFVVIQSKEDYDREQAERGREQLEKVRLFLKVVWWVFCSFLFSFLFKPFVSIKTFIFISWVFIVLFAISDLTKNLQLRSYIRATFAFLYGLWGLAFIVVGIIVVKTDYSVLLGSLGIGGLFLWLCYKNLKKYTRLIDKIFHK